MRTDLVLYDALHRFWGANRFVDLVAIFFADVLTYVLLLGVVAFFFIGIHDASVRVTAFWEMLVAFLVSRGVLTEVIQALVHRTRPFVRLGFIPPFKPLTTGAFPSGHMAGLFSIAAIMFAFDIRWGVVYMGLSLLVGLARIFVGVHWPSDILAGIALGLGTGFAVHSLAPSFLTHPSIAGGV